MTSFRRMVVALGLGAAALSWPAVDAAAQAKPGELEAVLRQMDEGSTRFHSAQADFRKDLYERVVKETTTQLGAIYYLRTPGGIQMGTKFTQPVKIVEIKDGMIRLFDPGADHLTEISIKNNQTQYESFLTLGFGGSGTELAKKWTISYLGTEQLNDGKKLVSTVKLDLVAKDANTRNTFSHIVIWVEPQQDISLKQQFFQPSGDMQTVTFTNVRYNMLKKSDMDGFAIKTDKKTSVDRR